MEIVKRLNPHVVNAQISGIRKIADAVMQMKGMKGNMAAVSPIPSRKDARSLPRNRTSSKAISATSVIPASAVAPAGRSPAARTPTSSGSPRSG